MLTHASLFTGIGGFDLAFDQAGFVTTSQVELDVRCRSILARHWPDVPRYADVRHVGGGALGSVDVITGGFPCQDVSMAGARAGLAGARSGLFFDFMRIVEEVRDATGFAFPRAVVIENVPGLLTSNGGADFGVVVQTLAGLGAVDIQWTVLDARRWLPQRRRRVFVVARFDHGTERGPEVLPVASGGGRHLGPLDPTQPGAAPGPGSSTRLRRQFDGTDDDSVTALTRGLGSGGPDAAHAQAGWLVPDIAKTLTSPASGGSRNDDGTTWVATGLHMKQDPISSDDGTPALGATSGGMAVFTKAARARHNEDAESWRPGDATPTLNVFDNAGEVRATVLAVQGPLFTGHERGREGGTQAEWREGVSSALRAGDGGSSRSNYVAGPNLGVRRLTPRECERLQGFPDDWTALGHDSATIPDTTRYRMAGNAVAVPCAHYVAHHLRAALELP